MVLVNAFGAIALDASVQAVLTKLNAGVGVTLGSDHDTVAIGTITATDAVVAVPAGDGTVLTGTPTAASYVQIAAPGGDSTWDAQITGTFGGGIVYFEGSFDGGTSWLPLNGRQSGIVNTVLGFSTAVAGMWRGNTSGTTHVRVRVKGATTPSIAVTLRVASGVGAVFLNASIPAGTNRIGTVGLSDGTNNGTVKAASTAAVAADTALVVAHHPSSPTPAGTNYIGNVRLTDGANNLDPFLTKTGSMTVVAQQIDGTTDLSWFQSVRIVLTGSGVVQAEYSFDGTTWANNPLIDNVTFVGSTVTYGAQISGAGTYTGPLLGKFFRLRLVVASGTTTATIIYSQAPFVPRFISLMGSTAAIGALAGSLPTGTNVLGAVGVGSTTQSAISVVTTASTNAVSQKASAGSLYELTISNPTATATFVKLYNKSSAPTVGTDVPILTIRVPPTGTAGDFQSLNFGANGKRFTAGIALAVTAAAVATDTAVAVAGVQISGTYA